MKRSLLYLFLTLAALVYAAVKFAASDSTASRARIISDGPVGENLRAFVSANVGNPDLPRIVADNFSGVRFVSVRNDMNGTAVITIRHKKTIAVWTDGEKYYPLLENGAHLDAPFAARPQSVVFKGAVPADVLGIIKSVAAAPRFFAKADFLEWVEGRRWNAILFDRARVMLPDRNAAAAIAKIESSGILGKKFSVLDLRDPERMLVK
ncbi:MAG: cell division protein FtsQ [Rickettsiales bacterium]|jgi:hypothetical protein|nr:cell division protein FtsQ [Rickettsiales bacterium]